MDVLPIVIILLKLETGLKKDVRNFVRIKYGSAGLAVILFTINKRHYYVIPEGIINLKLLNKPLASCFLINLGVLLSHIAYFDKSIGFHLFLIGTIEFLLPVFFYNSNKRITFPIFG